MDGWSIIWQHSDRIAAGFKNTLILFVISASAAFIVACFICYLLEGKQNLARKTLRGVMDFVRMLPFLFYVYVLYYGLPEIGIRLDPWVAGLTALITYHSCYFAEIMRSTRVSLPQGQAESAKAHGFPPFTMYRRILLPQMILKSGTVFGNQLVAMLKETAFLSIITVYELTAAANDVQSTYFVPMPSFIVAIALYWFVSLGIEAFLAGLNRYSRKRGLSYE